MQESLYIYFFHEVDGPKLKIRYEIYPLLLRLEGECDNRVDRDELYIFSEGQICKDVSI